MGVKDKLLGCSFVESGIALRGVAERKNGGVYDFCNGQAVMQDGLHELAVVLRHRGLASVEAVRFRPAEAKTHLQIAGLAGFVPGARVFGNVETGDPDRTRGSDYGHEGVEDSSSGAEPSVAP